MKAKSVFVCSNCGNETSQWSGRCTFCKEWNTITELKESALRQAEPAKLQLISSFKPNQLVRLKTGIEEFDRVLGSEDPGLVRGSVVLLAGTPGVGKSTLLLLVASKIKNTLYFSAEESLEQLHLRAKRLNVLNSSIMLSTERNLDAILAAVKEAKPELVIIDSIQTVFDESLPGTPGSVVQVREACWRVQQLAKQTGVAVVVVGHVTKEGAIAGPKTLEHLVDVVLYLEGEKRTGLRILRGDKNRYGSTEEVGIWQLTNAGFESVKDPGRLFTEILGEAVPGRALSVALEGSKSFIIEIQALVTKNQSAFSKRLAQGFDLNRLTVLIAVLENRLHLPLHGYDIYLNIVGGFTVKDPGTDLAVAAAILSSLTDQALPADIVLYGEIGLLGEVRPATQKSNREKEAKRLGYKPVLTKDLKNLLKLVKV